MAMPGDELVTDSDSSDYGYPRPIKKLLPSTTSGAVPAAPPNSLAPSLAPSPVVSCPPSPNLSASSPVPIPNANAAESNNHGQSHGLTLQVPGASLGTAPGGAGSPSTAPGTVHTAAIQLTFATGTSNASFLSNNNSGVMTPVGESNTATATTTQNP